MASLNQNVIKHKIGLLNLAAELGNVSKACKMMGMSRDTFYRYQNAVAEGGVEAQFDANRRKPTIKTGSTRSSKLPLSPMRLNNPRMDRYASATNCASEACLSRPLVSALFGCDTI